MRVAALRVFSFVAGHRPSHWSHSFHGTGDPLDAVRAAPLAERAYEAVGDLARQLAPVLPIPAWKNLGELRNAVVRQVHQAG